MLLFVLEGECELNEEPLIITRALYHLTFQPSNSERAIRHRSAKHRNVCHSTKYMMLHVRDCSGLLSNGEVCPFPWCRKTKHLLFHLVTCERKEDGSVCSICCPQNLSSNLMDLVGLNAHRRKIFIDKVAKAKAVLAAHPKPITSSQISVTSSIRPPPLGNTKPSIQGATIASTKTEHSAASSQAS